MKSQTCKCSFSLPLPYKHFTLKINCIFPMKPKHWDTTQSGPWHSAPCVLRSFALLISQQELPTKNWYQRISCHTSYVVPTQYDVTISKNFLLLLPIMSVIVTVSSGEVGVYLWFATACHVMLRGVSSVYKLSVTQFIMNWWENIYINFALRNDWAVMINGTSFKVLFCSFCIWTWKNSQNYHYWRCTGFGGASRNLCSLCLTLSHVAATMLILLFLVYGC